MTFERKNNTGTLFLAQKNKEKSPDYTGQSKIGMEEYYISGWKNQAKSGKVYLSLKFEPVNNNGMEPELKSEKVAEIEITSEDIPF